MPGADPRTAQRVANELREKAPVVMAMAGLIGTTTATTHELEPDEAPVVEDVAEDAPAPTKRPRAKRGPDPSAVAQALVAQGPSLVAAGWKTLARALLALAGTAP